MDRNSYAKLEGYFVLRLVLISYRNFSLRLDGPKECVTYCSNSWHNTAFEEEMSIKSKPCRSKIELPNDLNFDSLVHMITLDTWTNAHALLVPDKYII